MAATATALVVNTRAGRNELTNKQRREEWNKWETRANIKLLGQLLCKLIVLAATLYRVHVRCAMHVHFRAFSRYLWFMNNNLYVLLWSRCVFWVCMTLVCVRVSVSGILFRITIAITSFLLFVVDGCCSCWRWWDFWCCCYPFIVLYSSINKSHCHTPLCSKQFFNVFRTVKKWLNILHFFS